MLPFEYIHNMAMNAVPSMRWDGVEPLCEWQARAKEKLAGLLGLDKMVPTGKNVVIDFDREEENWREIRFRFESEPGYFVPCHMCIPKNTEGKLPAVICLQGHSRGMHLSLGRAIYPGDAADLGGDRDFCVRAVKEGFIGISLEQRDFGECGGTEKGPQCQNPTLTNLLLGRTTIGERVWDVKRCLDVLTDDFADKINADELYVLGNSGGGTATVYSLALEERFAGGMPSCAVSTFAESIGAMSHCTCNYVPHILEYFDMCELLAMAAPKKLVVVSGKEDPIFPIDGAKRMVAEAAKAYAAAGVPDRIAHAIGGGGHRFYANIAWAALKEMN